MDQKYDAFISYKHGDLDGAIALKLQTLLEHLRIPSSNKNKVKKIERIFLDTGELSSSADFVQQVEGALKNADLPDLGAVALSPDGKKAAVSFYLSELSLYSGKEAFTGTLLFDLETGEKKTISEYPSLAVKFTDSNTISMIPDLATGYSMLYTNLYSYAELCQHSEEILGDKELTDADLQALLTE